MARYDFHFPQIIVPELSKSKGKTPAYMELRHATSPWVSGCSIAVLQIPFCHGGFTDFAQSLLNVCLSWQPITHSKTNKGTWSNPVSWQKLCLHGCERYLIISFLCLLGEMQLEQKDLLEKLSEVHTVWWMSQLTHLSQCDGLPSSWREHRVSTEILKKQSI